MKVVVPLHAASHAGRTFGHCPSDAAIEAALSIAERFAGAKVTVAAFDEADAGSLAWALAAGADRAVLHAASLAPTLPDYVEAICALAAREKPDLLLLPAESNGDLEKLISLLGMQIVPDVVAIDEITPATVKVTARERRQLVTYSIQLPAILTVDAAAFPIRAVTVSQVVALGPAEVIERAAKIRSAGPEPIQARSEDRGPCKFVKSATELASIIAAHMPPSAPELEIAAGRQTGRIARLASHAAGERPPLSSARVVVAGGRAFDDSAQFEREIGGLADVLGAAVAGTGAGAAAGLSPASAVVGQSRLSIAPYLYIAAGISGVDQHIGGLADAHTVVAIDRDADAPIFGRADFALVADIHAALRELIAALEINMPESNAEPFVSRQRVRFDQLDALGMLHNAQYLVLFERARTDFWYANGYHMDERTADWPYYVRRNEVNYYRALYAETDVTISVTVDKVGQTSLTLKHELHDDKGDLIADGLCVLVRVDKTTKRPIAWSDWFRERFTPSVS